VIKHNIQNYDCSLIPRRWGGPETRGCCKPSPDVRKVSGQRFDQYPSIICSAGSQTSLMSDQQ